MQLMEQFRADADAKIAQLQAEADAKLKAESARLQAESDRKLAAANAEVAKLASLLAKKEAEPSPSLTPEEEPRGEVGPCVGRVSALLTRGSCCRWLKSLR